MLEQSREAHFEPLRRRWLLESGLAVCHGRSSGMERIRPSLGQGLVTLLQERAQLDRLVVLRPHLKSESPPSVRRDLDDVLAEQLLADLLARTDGDHAAHDGVGGQRFEPSALEIDEEAVRTV